MRKNKVVRLLFLVLVLTYLSIFLVLLVHHRAISDQILASTFDSSASHYRTRYETFEQISFAKETNFAKFSTIKVAPLIRPRNLVANCQNLSFVVMLKSRPAELFQRMAVRNGWGKTLSERLVFVVGVSVSAETNGAVEHESSIFGDLLQVDVIDAYRNLSIKSLAILQWIEGECQGARAYVQGDSDALVNAERLEQFLLERWGQKSGIYGKCWDLAVPDRMGKHAVNPLTFASAHFPSYCSGRTLVMMTDVPFLLLNALRRAVHFPYLSVDDVVFSGLVAESAGVFRKNMPSEFLTDQELEVKLDTAMGNSCTTTTCPLDFVAASEFSGPKRMMDIWTKLDNYRRNCCSV